MKAQLKQNKWGHPIKSAFTSFCEHFWFLKTSNDNFCNNIVEALTPLELISCVLIASEGNRKYLSYLLMLLTTILFLRAILFKYKSIFFARFFFHLQQALAEVLCS
jgi:hypothetical protein